MAHGSITNLIDGTAFVGHSSITTTEKVYAPICQGFVAEAMTKMDAHLAVKRAEHEASQPKPPPRIALVANGR